MPPSHAGMVPAALPAFSAPMGVSVVPSFASSDAVSCAEAGSARAAPTAIAAQVFVEFISFLLCLVWGRRASERIAHGDRVEVAVLERIGARAEARGLAGRDGASRRRLVGAAERAPAEVRGVLRIDQPLALVFPRSADGDGLGVLVERRAHALHVVREGDARCDVAAEEEV